MRKKDIGIGLIGIFSLVIVLGFLITANTNLSKRKLNSTQNATMIEPVMGIPNDFDENEIGMFKDDVVSKQTMRLAPSPGIPPFFETAGESAAEIDQKIIKTAELELKVNNASESVSKIISLAENKNGFVQESSVWEEYDGTKTGSVTIKVPSNSFEGTLEEIKKIAVVVETESIHGQDVTEEFSDLQAQLRNAIRQEETFLSILEKATNVQDVLSVQRELGNIRAQIERLEGRVKYLENRTSFSTITTYLSEEPTINAPTKEFRPSSSIRDAIQTLINLGEVAIISIIYLVIVGGGALIPVVVVAAIIIWIILSKRNKNNIKSGKARKK